ncbi:MULTISPECIES: hypothetical protein [Bacillus]|uniref:Uncharacterized protein n=1 Tax=Bacillus glycinifermentans TaxID=1664069 RepID=A0AAJ4D2B6_9BACI|nr:MULTISPECIES: hypothetical protein [Bacillus]MDU0069892.1 hypothetical protein [Bacillus sp. IG6]MED8020952.1 hypothetical protein [Bacillus glycinifermentans]QAT65279.1 hypothetical protein EQZ20_10315 [Bacillus glycinifermentans]WKB79257.1 hypothetical protein QYM22_10570 [Bacillus glycinifermentans]SCA85839.1 alpha/beta fold family hydrolase [Bacillus glycinifermentans]
MKFKNKSCDEVHVEINGERVDVNSLEEGSVTLERYKNTRANSDGFEALYPKLNDEALIHAAKNHIRNIPIKRNPVTYEESLAACIAPELIKRLELK